MIPRYKNLSKIRRSILFKWFENNLLKSNADKCHFLVSSSDAVSIRVNEYDIKL